MSDEWSGIVIGARAPDDELHRLRKLVSMQSRTILDLSAEIGRLREQLQASIELTAIREEQVREESAENKYLRAQVEAGGHDPSSTTATPAPVWDGQWTETG